MTSPAHAPRGTASDSLLTQVNVDNVLQVRNVLHKQERDIKTLLGQANRDLDLLPAGADPISADVTPLFRAKLDQIKQVHWAHVRELEEATERLRETALHYGFTENDVDESFKAHAFAGPLIDQ